MVLQDNINTYLEALETFDSEPFSLDDIPGFPYSEYTKNLARYQELDSWYTGTVLEEVAMSEQDKREVELYPVKINPIKGAVQKHVAILFGEAPYDERPLVYPRLLPTDGARSKNAKLAKDAENVLYQIWWESQGRSIQVENGINSQVFGGCVFKISFVPEDSLRIYPIRVEKVEPHHFVGLPSSDDPWSLKEAWIVRPISHRDAELNGVYIGDDVQPYLIEHYLPDKIEIRINRTDLGRVIDGKHISYSGENPFGFIPIVYIPHLRNKGFYGTSMIDDLKGLVKEINLRVADYGDAVSVDSHAYLAMRNVAGAPQPQQIAPGVHVLNLQSAPNFSGQERDPDVFDIKKPSASAPMKDLIDQLYGHYRRSAYIPPVADGEDEGSQRSGLTLAMRMWPLTSHVMIERDFWTNGLDILNRMILRILFTKEEGGITSAHLNMRIKENWAPMLPRDREMIIREVTERMRSMLGSPQHLIQLLGDVDDVNQEVLDILAFQKILSAMAIKNKPQEESGSSNTPKQTDSTEKSDEDTQKEGD